MSERALFFHIFKLLGSRVAFRENRLRLEPAKASNLEQALLVASLRRAYHVFRADIAARYSRNIHSIRTAEIACKFAASCSLHGTSRASTHRWSKRAMHQLRRASPERALVPLYVIVKPGAQLIHFAFMKNKVCLK